MARDPEAAVAIGFERCVPGIAAEETLCVDDGVPVGIDDSTFDLAGLDVDGPDAGFAELLLSAIE